MTFFLKIPSLFGCSFASEIVINIPCHLKKRNLREVRMRLFCTSGQQQEDTNISLFDTNTCHDKICVVSEIWFENTLQHI